MDLDSLKILLSKHNQYCERLCHELDYGSDINSIRVRDFARKDWVRTDNHNLNLSNSILAKKVCETRRNINEDDEIRRILFFALFFALFYKTRTFQKNPRFET